MKALMAAAGLTLLAAIPRPVPAQASVAGTWSTEFDIGIRSENGVETSMGKRAATMTLTVVGDSVFGVWQVAAQPNTPPPAPIKLKGIRTGNRITLAAEPVERIVRMNDDEQRVKMISTYALELRGDELVGTTANTSADHAFDGPERSFLAKRK